MNNKRISVVMLATGLAAMAMALTPFLKSFDGVYKVKKESTLGKAACMSCHATAKGGKQLNPYGASIQVVMKEAKTKKLTPEILAKVEGLDSDKDGMKNIDEIKKDRLPGVAGK